MAFESHRVLSAMLGIYICYHISSLASRPSHGSVLFSLILQVRKHQKGEWLDLSCGTEVAEVDCEVRRAVKIACFRFFSLRGVLHDFSGSVPIFTSLLYFSLSLSSQVKMGIWPFPTDHLHHPGFQSPLLADPSLFLAHPPLPPGQVLFGSSHLCLLPTLLPCMQRLASPSPAFSPSLAVHPFQLCQAWGNPVGLSMKPPSPPNPSGCSFLEDEELLSSFGLHLYHFSVPFIPLIWLLNFLMC